MEASLKDLRNKATGAFLIINTIFMMVIFTLQVQDIDTGLYIRWPCGGTSLYLEPIGFMFLLLFGVVLVVQTVGMIIHRVETYLHIMASTSLWKGKNGATKEKDKGKRDLEEKNEGEKDLEEKDKGKENPEENENRMKDPDIETPGTSGAAREQDVEATEKTKLKHLGDAENSKMEPNEGTDL